MVRIEVAIMAGLVGVRSADMMMPYRLARVIQTAPTSILYFFIKIICLIHNSFGFDRQTEIGLLIG